MQIPGKIMFFLNDSDNQYYKKLLPRTNLYYLNLTLPTQSLCNNTAMKETRKIYIVS